MYDYRHAVADINTAGQFAVARCGLMEGADGVP